jgi:DnaJ-class molecular chaperone
MTKAEALAKLGLIAAEASSERSIKAAWASRVRGIHPDTSLGAADPDVQIRELTEARDLLLLQATDARNVCKPCRGTGRLKNGGWGSVDCPHCRGTGDKL